MLERCCQDTKEAMICIDNKYEFIKFTNFYQLNHNFLYFSAKTSHVNGSILNWGVVWMHANIAHFDAICMIIILPKNLK